MADITYLEEDLRAAAWHWWVIAVSGICIGSFCIGCVGIGGVIYVPMLVMLGMEPQRAIGSMFLGVFFAQFPKLYMWQRAGKICWRRAVDFAIPSVPGALAGAYLVTKVSGAFLGYAVSILCLVSALKIQSDLCKAKRGEKAEKASLPPLSPEEYELHSDLEGSAVVSCMNESQSPPSELNDALVPSPSHGADADDAACVDDADCLTEAESVAPSPTSAAADSAAAPARPDSIYSASRAWIAKRGFLGLVVGFLSSLTGTGGPVIMVPLYFTLWPETPAHILIGTIQPFTLCLSSSAVTGAMLYGKVDVVVAAGMFVLSSVFITVGSVVGLRLPQETLKQGLVGLLAVTGVATLALRKSSKDDETLATLTASLVP